MAKKKKLLLILGVVLLVVGLGVALGLWALHGGADQPGEQVSGETATYTIEVKSAAGIPLKDVGLYIYEDSTLAELVAFLKTDDTGRTSFTDIARDSYVAVLDKVPTGYEAEAMYPLTGELTEIILQTGKMDSVDVENLTYKLGDAVLDFSVTGPDGTVYTLSELFEGKKAVVLNFFYNACQPCMMEFPFLQEAYAEYSDSIAVLAMNPVDGDDASIAALQKELGITFPMVKCGPEWESIMQLTAYPTTVIIDRFGNICLIHKGSVPDAKTFKDAFAYFSAEEYEQKLIEKIEDLLIEAPEGTEENPTEVGGQTSFEVEVQPGQVVYHELYKVFNMYLQIQSKNAYVIYNGETYYPKNGVVGLMISAPDTFTPAKIGIGNSGTEKETFKVYLSALKGSVDNPYTLTLGEFETNVAAGNEQGVYYTYTPTEDGALTLQCLSVSGGVKYGYFLYNTVTSVMHNLESDSKTDESGAVTVSVDARKGQRIQICISTLPDSENSYPAATFKFLATFTAGEVKDVVIQKNTAYTVTILDRDNNPVPSVSMVVDVAGKQEGFTTGSDGVAHISLPAGSYKGSIYIPDGYTAQKTDFQITEAAPNVTLKIQKIKRADYKVKVVGPQGNAIEAVLVRIGQDGAWLSTDANGVASANLVVGSYDVTILVTDPNYVAEDSYTFAENTTELTITLKYPAGTEGNPYSVDSYPYSTVRLSGAEEIYCNVAYSEGMTGIYIQDADAYIRCGETTYGADVNGVVSFTFDPEGESPVMLIIGNGGTKREKYTVYASYAPGSQENPYVVDAYPYTMQAMAANAENHYNLFPVEKVIGVSIHDPDAFIRCGDQQYTADGSGVVRFLFEEDVQMPVMLVVGNLGAEEKTFTLEAILPPVGSERNPYVVDAYPYTTQPLAANAESYYSFPVNRKVLGFTISDPDVSVMHNGQELPLESGVCTFNFDSQAQEETVLVIANKSAEEKTFTLEAILPPVGSQYNPMVPPALGNWAILRLQAGDEEGYYYSYTAQKTGTLSVRLVQPASVDIELTTSNRQALLSRDGANRRVTIDMEEGQTVLIHVYALVDEATGLIPAANARLNVTFAEGTIAPPPETSEPPTETTQDTQAPTTTGGSDNEDPGVEEYAYQVTVADIFGGGQANVGVIFMQNGVPKSVVYTNKNGVAEWYTEELAEYTVELQLDEAKFYYNKTGNVLTPADRELEIKVVAKVDESDYSNYYIGETEYVAYNVYLGGTQVKIGTGKSNFSAGQENNCFFAFTPTKPGTYQITTNIAGLKLSAWASTSYVYPQESDLDAVTKSISGSTVGNVTFLIGVKVDGSVTDVMLNVARIGEPEFNIADQPWTEWETGLTHTDAWKSKVGLVPVSGGAYYQLSSAPTYFDITAASGTYSFYYDEANGYYTLGKDGPVVLVNLNAKNRFVSLYERVNGNGQYGGSAVTRYFYDTTGKFVRKEKYTDYLSQCFECVSLNTIKEEGYHPLTKDLMYVLQNGFADWWNPDSPNYLDGFATANKEYAWLFACCYVS